jgi:sirohydrochlorin cobaltochelatase
MSLTRFAAPKAPATDPAWRRAGLLLCSHGVAGGPGLAAWHGRTIARMGLFGQVRACCLKGRPRPAQAIARMDPRQIIVFPLFMAEGYATATLLPQELARIGPGAERITLCRPLGSHPGLADLMVRMARRTCRERGWPVGETALVVMGHGTARAAGAGETALGHARRIAGSGAFPEAAAAFLDQPPSLEATLSRLRQRHRVVVGLFADQGGHGREDVPRLLARHPGTAAYAGPVGAHPEIPALIVDHIRTASAVAA